MSFSDFDDKRDAADLMATSRLEDLHGNGNPLYSVQNSMDRGAHGLSSPWGLKSPHLSTKATR